MDDWVAHGELDILAYIRVEAYYIYILDSLAFQCVIVLAHDLGTAPLQSVPSIQGALTHCWVPEQLECLYTIIVKFTFH